MMKYFAAILFAASMYVCHAQESKMPVNSGEIINLGIKAHDDEKYKDAIREFQKVPENDTNYILALYETGLSARADSQFNLAKSVTRQAIDLGPSPYNHDLWLMLGSIYDDEKKHDSALNVFRQTHQLYPNSFRTVNAIGINFYVQKKRDSAFHYFKKAVLMNPYGISPHYFLGMLAHDAGYPIQAMMSFTMALILSPDGSRSSASLNKLYTMANISDDIVNAMNDRKEESYLKEDYSELETYFKSKIALEKKYKIETRLDETLFRQLNLIFDKVNPTSNTEEFWGTLYGNLYKDIFKKGMFEGLTLRMIEGVNSAEAQKLVKSGKKDIEKTGQFISEHLDNIGYQRDLTGKVNRQEAGYFFEDNQPAGKGLSTDPKGKNLQGVWEFYNVLGNVARTTEFRNGKVNGLYKTFYYTGLPKEEINIQNEQINGVGKEYYDNGNLKSEATFVNGKKNGMHTQYYVNGSKSSEENYRNGIKDGPVKIYYQSGGIQYEGNHVNDKLEGPLKEYYRNGKLLNVIQTRGGKANGSYISYWFNGQIESKGEMLNGEKNGPFETYDINGKLSSKMNYRAGKLDGPAMNYYPNGKEQRISSYNNGDREGITKDLDEEGKLESITEYKKGHIKKITYYNVMTGAVASESIIDDKQKNLLKLCNVIGNVTTEVVTDRDGYYNGEFKRLYLDGKPSQISNYEQGKEQGKGTSYYKNGKVRAEYINKDDQLDGIYKSYFDDGQLQSEGYYVAGQKQGYWYTYNILGKLIEREYYLDGEFHGPQRYYFGNGKQSKVIWFDKGEETKIQKFDTLGKVVFDYKIQLGKDNFITEVNPLNKKSRTFHLTRNFLQGEQLNYLPNQQIFARSYFVNGNYDSVYTVYYPNGKVRVEGRYNQGSRQGAWKYYSPEGKLNSVNYYLNDESEGIDSVFYENGALEITVPYVSDDRHGWLCKYAPGGELMYKLHYRYGYLVGYTYEQADGTFIKEIPVENSGNPVTIKAYYKSGQVSTEFVYQNGDYHGKRNIYYPNGKVQFTVNYVNGNQDGEEKEYFPNGQVNYEKTYKNDRLHGAHKKYNEAGKLLMVENYVEGYEHGKSMYYDSTGKLQYTITNYWGEEMTVE
jgi:antitoxin component YwqK of YwqJK toxin-antitoxin module